MKKLVYATKINGSEIDGIVDVSVNPPKLYCIVDTKEVAEEIIESLNDFENIKKLLSSDSTYNLLRFGVKSPSRSGMDNFEDSDYYDLYIMAQNIRTKS